MFVSKFKLNQVLVAIAVMAFAEEKIEDHAVVAVDQETAEQRYYDGNFPFIPHQAGPWVPFGSYGSYGYDD